jgi:tRNA A37 methylthiotransferase MiaB
MNDFQKAFLALRLVKYFLSKGDYKTAVIVTVVTCEVDEKDAKEFVDYIREMLKEKVE